MADPITAALLAGTAVQSGSFAYLLVQTGVTLAISAGTSLALQALTPKQKITQEGQRLQNAKVTSSSEGQSIPRVYGKFRTAGNIIWATRFKETVVTTTTNTGGKGGGGGGGQQVTTTEYKYSVSVAVGLCEGVIDRITKLYMDGQEVTLENFSYAFYQGTTSQSPDPTIEAIEGAGNVPAYRGLCYLVLTDLDLTTYGNRVPQISCELEKLPSGQSQTLQSIIEDLCSIEGLTPSDIDASDLSSVTISGYYTEGVNTPREAIEELASIYFFDVSDIGGIMTFRRRTSPPVVSVDLQDVIISEENPSGFEIDTQQEEELPSEVLFNFMDEKKNFSLGSVSSERIGSDSNNTLSLGGSIVLSESDARNKANIALREAYTARDTLRFSLPLQKYISLNCGDYVEIQISGYIFKAKIVAKEISTKMTLEVTSVGTRKVDALPEEIYVDQVIPEGPQPSVVDKTPTPTQLIFMNLPLLPTGTLEDIEPLMAAYQTPWFGGVNVFREDGSGGHILSTQIPFPATTGVTTTDLSPGVTDLWDMKNSVTVSLDNPTDNLSSYADITVLNGANTFALLTPSGEWEVFQAANVTLNMDGTYTLSRLLRGQLGTEYYMGDPTPSGSTFVVIDPNRLTKLPTTQTGIGITQDLRYGPFGFTIDNPVYTDESYTPKATAFRPYSPVRLQETYSSGDIILSWIRRSRFGGDNWEQVEVPLNEGSESYEVDIYNGPTVVRTLTSSTPQVTYTSAQQISDFGSNQTTLSWRVHQMSTSYGRGTPAIG